MLRISSVYNVTQAKKPKSAKAQVVIPRALLDQLKAYCRDRDLIVGRFVTRLITQTIKEAAQ